MRSHHRANNALRPISFEMGLIKNAEGSCLVKFGNTHVLCTASVDEKIPSWLRNGGLGWVTAEYGMLPRSTHTRMKREAKEKGQSGRSQEIQRLIGRSLRAGIDRVVMGERQIIIDCDVIQADGGTRTAAISGGFLALTQALKGLKILKSPILDTVAAVSCGVIAGEVMLDLDYAEDSKAGADANFVMSGAGQLIEVQASAEGKTFSMDQLQAMLALASGGIKQIMVAQDEALKAAGLK